jgi:hypothetical protein
MVRSLKMDVERHKAALEQKHAAARCSFQPNCPRTPQFRNSYLVEPPLNSR